jgi:hypothetical protein
MKCITKETRSRSMIINGRACIDRVFLLIS